MTYEDFQKLHKNDYVFYRWKEYDDDDDPFREFAGFITKKRKNGVTVYSELCIDGDEWELDEVFVKYTDIVMKLELETLQEQLIRKYSYLLI